MGYEDKLNNEMKEVAITQPLSYFLGLVDYILNQKKTTVNFYQHKQGGVLMLKTVGVDVKEKISELVELAYKGDQEAIEKLIKIKKELGGN